MDVVHATWGPDRRLHLWAEDGTAFDTRAAAEANASPNRKSKTPPTHPFASHAFSIPTSDGTWPIETSGSGIDLLLPIEHGWPAPSPGLANVAGPRDAGRHESRTWHVPSAAQDGKGALAVLLALTDRQDPAIGGSLRFFAHAAFFATELVARGRFLPHLDVTRNPRTTWRPAFGAGDVGRWTTLAGAMPDVALANRSEDPESRGRGLDDFLSLIVGSLLAEPLSEVELRRDASSVLRALLGRGSLKGGSVVGDAVADALDAWEAAVRPTVGPYRTLFRLREPGSPDPKSDQERASTPAVSPPGALDGSVARPVDAPVAGVAGVRGVTPVAGAARSAPSAPTEEPAAEPIAEESAKEPTAEECAKEPTAEAPTATLPAEPWRLEVLLGARADPSVVVPASAIMTSPSPLQAFGSGDPEAALLVDLARASRLYPPLEATLESAVPADIELDTAGAHAFLREGAPLLADAGYTLLLPAWWRHRRRRLGLRLQVRPRRQQPARTGVEPGLGAAELVDYDWRVAIGDETLSDTELATLARAKGGLVRIRGQWVEVEAAELGAALRAVEASARGGARPVLTVAEVLRTALGLAPTPGGLDVTGIDATGWLGAVVGDATGAPARATPIPTPPGFVGALRPYQEQGLGWLAFLDRLGFGGILADDMGLGKTPQLLALLAVEQSNVPPQERLGPTLVVCPMSLVGNWQREAARFTPELRVHVHHGGDRLRAEELAAATRDVDLVITTYALVARDRVALGEIPWRRVVLDEAQEIKNSETDQSRAARSIRAPSRFALTGTPIENRLTELWTIMDFANPGLLGSEDRFRNRFSVPIERWRDEGVAERLRRATGPFILRRVKTDKAILPDLPEKLEFGVSCNLTREQATLYQAVVDELMPDLEGTDDDQEYRGKVLRAILRLKQVCDHPALFLGDGSPLRGRSGKLERLEEVLDTVLEGRERALVFTQFAEWGERLVPYLRERFGREVLYLHGGVPRAARDRMVERFAGGSVPIFVLSLKAGGRGLNLVAASHVIHYDRWWNPAVEDQASDRAYRIGQTRDVQVRTFVAVGTLEEKIADMLAAKRALAATIVRAGERAFTELSTAELRAILTLGSDAVAEDDGDGR